MIKRVEVQYRGIFQKTLGKYIGSDIVQIASRMGKVAFSNGRYSDAPERNGIPANISRSYRLICPKRSWRPSADPLWTSPTSMCP